MPNQPSEAAHRSLQINIDSEDDAKAVIQHLQAIKNRFDMLQESGLVDSIEFCIAAPIRRKVDADLLGAVRWCRTWLKSVSPFEGNVHYALPHYAPGPPRPARTLPAAAESSLAQAPTIAPLLSTPPSAPDSLGRMADPPTKQQAHGKSKRPVSASMAES